MTDDDTRMRTTHVGSLVRPDELVAYLRKIDAGEEYDRGGLRGVPGAIGRGGRPGPARRRHRHRQRRRVRQVGLELLRVRAPRRHRAARAPARRRELRERQRRADRLGALSRVLRRVLRQGAGVREPRRRLGLRLRRDLHGRRRHRPRHRESQGRDGRRASAGGVPAGRGAGLVLPESHRRALRLRAGRAAGHRRGAGRGVPRDRRRGAVPPDRRCLHPVHVRRARPAGDDGRLPGMGPPAHRRAEPRARGHPRGPDPLPRLLGQLERARTRTTSRCATSSTWSSRSTRAPTSTSTPTRATSTSGAYGRTSSCRRARRSPRA